MNIAESERYSRQVAEMLKRIRKQKGLSQKTLAEKAGVSRPAVQHIEKGIRNPTLMVCHALAVALGVSLSEILAEVERES